MMNNFNTTTFKQHQREENVQKEYKKYTASLLFQPTDRTSEQKPSKTHMHSLPHIHKHHQLTHTSNV